MADPRLEGTLNCVLGQAFRDHISVGRMAKNMGLAPETLRRRINNPEQLRISELLGMCDQLGLQVTISVSGPASSE